MCRDRSHTAYARIGRIGGSRLDGRVRQRKGGKAFARPYGLCVGDRGFRRRAQRRSGSASHLPISGHDGDQCGDNPGYKPGYKQCSVHRCSFISRVGSGVKHYSASRRRPFKAAKAKRKYNSCLGLTSDREVHYGLAEFPKQEPTRMNAVLAPAYTSLPTYIVVRPSRLKVGCSQDWLPYIT
jgi:hypothetical protein